MRTKRETRTTFSWHEGMVKELLAKNLYEETGVVVEPSQITRVQFRDHEQFVRYAVIIKEKIA